jgi:hypothetical protein
MALVNPNIAMSFRQPDIQAPNALAQFAQIQQIQGGQQAQELNRLQLQEYQRSREEEEGTRNFLRGRKLSDPETITGLTQFGKTGLGIAESLQRQNAAALTSKNVQSQIDERQLGMRDKQLKFAWNSVGDSSTPEAAIAQLVKGVQNGLFDMKSITPDIQKLQKMTTPEEFRQYRAESIQKIVEAKDKLAFMLPKIARQAAGGQILSIQDNPMMPGYGQPIAGANIAMTMTPGEVASNRIAQGNLSLAQQRLAFERANPGFELKEAEDGSIVGVNKRTLQAFPITIGGGAPAAAPSAGGQPAPAGALLRGKGTALTESQGNATAYGMRMKEANAILEPLEKAGKTNTGLIKNVVGGTVGLIPLIGDKLEDVSGSVFNALPQVLGGLSPEQQQVAQARINFITAILRKESGAAIGRDEFATAEKNYFPKPGDDAAAIAQKQQARRTAIKAMEIQAGPGSRQMGGAGGLPGASANDPLGLGIK